MFRCHRCGALFEDPIKVPFCYEDMFGVSSFFRDKHYGTYDSCPDCGSDDVELIEDNDEDKE